MKTNATPLYDASDNLTGCCPRFKPEGWDDQRLHFNNKPFVEVKTKSLMQIPLNMGRIFEKTFKAIEDAGALDEKQAIVLSRDLSPWAAEHLFAVTKDVQGEKLTRLTGEYRSKVFEGPYRNAKKWAAAFESNLKAEGLSADKIYFSIQHVPNAQSAMAKTTLSASRKQRGLKGDAHNY